MTRSSLLVTFLGLQVLVGSCHAFTSTHHHHVSHHPQLHASKNEINVADLGLTMEDLEAPLPSELLQGIATSGYESTSRIPSVEDNGCQWTEFDNDFDVTLKIPGLRGQPAACLAVVFATTSCTISAFGRPVWSCILKGTVDPDSANFMTEDGPDMIPVVQLSVQKKATTERWGGFIEQIGEDSLL